MTQQSPGRSDVPLLGGLGAGPADGPGRTDDPVIRCTTRCSTGNLQRCRAESMWT